MIDSDMKLFNEMLIYANDILEFVEGVDIDAFMKNKMMQSACMLNILEIGECVKKLSNSTIEKYNNIAWHEMRGFRNRIAHAYLSVSLEAVWDSTQIDIPKLIKDIKSILSSQVK